MNADLYKINVVNKVWKNN